jgi:polyisoprenoid-binding protein YceI
VLIAVGAVAYSFLKPPKEASGPIAAIPVEVEQPASDEPPEPPDTVEPKATVEAVAAAPATATSEPEPVTQAEAKVSGSDADPNPAIFEIVQAESEVRFIIDEVLNGAPKTVVGVTDQVAGEIAIYADDPAKTKIGTILVNARTLVTDNEFRNRAIKNRILYTDDYEFIAFTPTEIVGLPDAATISEGFSFQIVGDLTVRDVTKQVAFDAQVTPVSETQLEGTASTTILYADFDLTIPEARNVASVDDEVILEIEFSAAAK